MLQEVVGALANGVEGPRFKTQLVRGVFLKVSLFTQQRRKPTSTRLLPVRVGSLAATSPHNQYELW